MSEALKLRQDAVKAIKAKTDNADKTITKLKAHASPSGLKIDKDADFAFAAIDIGQRLLSEGEEKEAEKLFKEAEKSLDAVVKRLPDTAPREKAMYLAKLALIRGKFLNKAREAKADIEAAITLQPDDEYLKQSRDQLASENAQLFPASHRG